MTREKLIRFVAAAVLTLGVGGGVAVAQGQPATPAPGAPAKDQPGAGAAAPGGATGTPASGGIDASGGLSRQVNIPPAEQVTQSDADLGRMEAARDTVRRQLMDARAQRDVVKTLCLNDKLSQLNVAISSAQERHDALQAAAKRGDTDLATHEFTIMSVLRQRSDQLMAEANQCLGEEIGTPGNSSVITTIDKNLPVEDPSQYPNFSLSTDPPSCASCFL
jgi:hypothetical protein